MAKYEITFSCGHTESRDIIGKVKDREAKAEWLSGGLCSECWEAEKKRQFEEKNKKAAEEAKEYGLPELTGSEKQVAWATTIRQAWLKTVETNRARAMNRMEQKPEQREKLAKQLEEYDDAVERILKMNHDARYWIDHRGHDPIEMVTVEATKMRHEDTQPQVPESIVEEAIEDMTIRPSEPSTNLVTEIRIQGNIVVAQYPEKNEEFRLLARGLNFTWQNGRWERKTGIKSGGPLDRAAELGVKLLAKGFPVRIYNDTLEAKILTSDYEPECSRWVMKNTDTGKFILKWDRDEADFYNESKRLPGVKWESGSGMLVPKEAFREILDFADRYQFKLSPGAQELAEKAREEFETAMVADVKVPKKDRLPQPGRPKLTADQVDGEIDESLRDED